MPDPQNIFKEEEEEEECGFWPLGLVTFVSFITGHAIIQTPSMCMTTVPAVDNEGAARPVLGPGPGWPGTGPGQVGPKSIIRESPKA